MRFKYLTYYLFQMIHEVSGVRLYVADLVFSYRQRGVVVFCHGVLDEQQGRGYGQLLLVQPGMLPHDEGIEHRLQIVVGVLLADIGGVEDF